MREIIRNAAQCRLCGDVIESNSVHDFKTCSCGAISIDGGREELRRIGEFENFIELAEEIDEDDKEPFRV